jgi:hypothetical protein
VTEVILVIPYSRLVVCPERNSELSMGSIIPSRHPVSQAVIPMKIGIHSSVAALVERWIPACAGMTVNI